MWKNLRRAFVGDGAGEQGLAGAGRAVEQHALGRIDAEALEQLGMAERQLDHLAQRVDRVAHAAEVVIGDVGAALRRRLAVYSGSSSTAVLASMWTMPLGVVDTTTSRSSCSANAGALSICRMWSGMSALIALVPGGRDGVAFDQRPAGEGALQRIGRALQPDVGLRRGKDDAGRGL